MGILSFREFSSIPTFRKKIRAFRERKEKYVINLSEWAASHGETIIRQTNATGTTILHTVPRGLKLFLTEAHTSVSNEAVAASVRLVIGTDIILFSSCSTGGQNNQTLSFRSFVKVPSGGTVSSVISSALGDKSVGFVGFQLPESFEIV